MKEGVRDLYYNVETSVAPSFSRIGRDFLYGTAYNGRKHLSLQYLGLYLFCLNY